jgi:hypothetical protein
MSDGTDVLMQHLSRDLRSILSDEQLGYAASCKPLWPDATVKQAQAYAICVSLLKKYNDDDQPSKSACKAALDKFLEVNSRNADVKILPVTSIDELLLGTLKSKLYNLFCDMSGEPDVITYEELFVLGNVGPGASIAARGDDFYTKVFDSPISAYSDALPYVWGKLTDRDPRWRYAERLRSKRYGHSIKKGSKVSFVNKNVTTARLISSETTLNMWFQKGLGCYIERKIRSTFNINLSSQPEINGLLAKRGSITDGLATIDLESASDSISLAFVKEFIPRNLQFWLMHLRAPRTKLPNGSFVDLNMVSTMGNGFTFPLQTAVFSCVVAAVYEVCGKPLRGSGKAEFRNFGVFGDDMIVESDVAHLVLHLLHLIGFRANAGKTYVKGPFRESCGSDYYLGQPCRGVYLKRLRHQQDFFVAINTLNRWSTLTGIPLPNLVGHLCSRVPKWHPVVPWEESDDAGVKVPWPVFSHGVKALKGGRFHYCYQTPVRNTLTFTGMNATAEVVAEGPIAAIQPRRINFPGAHIAVLGGYVRGHVITVRQTVVTYMMKRRMTPGWCRRDPKGVVLPGQIQGPLSGIPGYLESINTSTRGRSLKNLLESKDALCSVTFWAPWYRAVLGNLPSQYFGA